ncbi:hypothetical protein B0H19DRAFT_1080574 [Mycena capillaripes]|nr:hypothetical protein B0H19DRAFT_1080574 [Mycena capillaripes]
MPYLRRRVLLRLDAGFPASLALYKVAGLRRAPPFSPSAAPPRSAPHRLPSTSSAGYSDMRADIFKARECDLARETVIISYAKHACTSLDRGSVRRTRRAILSTWEGWNLRDPKGSYKEWVAFANKICAYGLETSEAYHRAARAQLWEELPSNYGLPRWDPLEKMKNEALAVDPRWSSCLDVLTRIINIRHTYLQNLIAPLPRSSHSPVEKVYHHINTAFFVRV